MLLRQTLARHAAIAVVLALLLAWAGARGVSADTPVAPGSSAPGQGGSDIGQAADDISSQIPSIGLSSTTGELGSTGGVDFSAFAGMGGTSWWYDMPSRVSLALSDDATATACGHAFISALVTDSRGLPVPDNTMVFFSTTRGSIFSKSLTNAGYATVELQAHMGDGPVGVVARTDNGTFDAEIFSLASCPQGASTGGSPGTSSSIGIAPVFPTVQSPLDSGY